MRSAGAPHLRADVVDVPGVKRCEFELVRVEGKQSARPDAADRVCLQRRRKNGDAAPAASNGAHGRFATAPIGCQRHAAQFRAIAGLFGEQRLTEVGKIKVGRGGQGCFGLGSELGSAPVDLGEPIDAIAPTLQECRALGFVGSDDRQRHLHS